MTQPDTTEQEDAVHAQTVTPMLDYADGPAAMDWLAEAFGFAERTRLLDDDGRVMHGEMLAGDGLIMVGSTIDGYEGPRRHSEHCPTTRAWLQTPYIVDGLLVRVPDVDAHFAHAKAAGARILSEPEDQPYGRLYRVEDLEGHRWMFLTGQGD